MSSNLKLLTETIHFQGQHFMHGHLSLLFHLATVVFHFVIMLFSHCPCNFKIEQPFSPNIFEWAIYVPYYTNIYIYIYLFHARYLYNDIFRYVNSRYHKVLSHDCLSKLITRVVIETGPGYKFSGFLLLPLLQQSLPSQVRAASIISAGVVGSPQ